MPHIFKQDKDTTLPLISDGITDRQIEATQNTRPNFMEEI